MALKDKLEETRQAKAEEARRLAEEEAKRQADLQREQEEALAAADRETKARAEKEAENARTKITALQSEQQRLEALRVEIDEEYKAATEQGITAAEKRVILRDLIKDLVAEDADVLKEADEQGGEKRITNTRQALKSETLRDEEEVWAHTEPRDEVRTRMKGIKSKVSSELGEDVDIKGLTKAKAKTLVETRLAAIADEIDILEEKTPEDQEKKKAALRKDILKEHERHHYVMIGNIGKQIFVNPHDIANAETHGREFVRQTITDFYKKRIDDEVARNVKEKKFELLEDVEKIKAWPEAFVPALQTIKKFEDEVDATWREGLGPLLEAKPELLQAMRRQSDYAGARPLEAAHTYVTKWLEKLVYQGHNYDWLSRLRNEYTGMAEKIQTGKWRSFLRQDEALYTPESVLDFVDHFERHLASFRDFIAKEQTLPSSEQVSDLFQRSRFNPDIKSLPMHESTRELVRKHENYALTYEEQVKKRDWLQQQGELAGQELERKVNMDWVKAEVSHLEYSHRDLGDLVEKGESIESWRREADKAKQLMAKANLDFRDRAAERVQLYKSPAYGRSYSIIDTDLRRLGGEQSTQREALSQEIAELEKKIQAKKSATPGKYTSLPGTKEKHAKELAVLETEKQGKETALAELNQAWQERNDKSEKLVSLVEILNLGRLGSLLPDKEMPLGEFLEAIGAAIAAKNSEQLTVDQKALVDRYQRLKEEDKAAEQAYRSGR